MIDDLKKEVTDTVANIDNKNEKWLAVHKILNRYKDRDDFCDIRREICDYMKELTEE